MVLITRNQKVWESYDCASRQNIDDKNISLRAMLCQRKILFKHTEQCMDLTNIAYSGRVNKLKYTAKQQSIIYMC